MRNNIGIDESPKEFSKTLKADAYDIAVGRRCPKCLKLYPEIDCPEGNRCRHKKRA